MNFAQWENFPDPRLRPRFNRWSERGRSGEQLRDAGAENMFRESASGAKTNRREIERALRALAADDVFMVTRHYRLARSTRDLLNIFAAIT
jgi:DNA invertase Pin-like site-specific DNA recombinase